MNPRRKKRLATVVAVVGGVAVAIGLTLYALTQNIDLFYTPHELVQGKGPELQKPEVGQRLRIGGMVVVGSVMRDPSSLQVQFDLWDQQLGDAKVTVTYNGILPDLFREGQGIVAHGVLKSANVVDAFEVLAKHDEQYMPAEVAEAVKGIRHEKPNGKGSYYGNGG